MKSPVTITLAGKTYEIRRLTLGQQRALGLGVVKGNAAKQAADAAKTAGKPFDPVQAEAEAYDYFTDIVVAGLQRDYPDLTAAALYGLETDLAELTAAARKILEFTGYMPVGAAKSGEAKAAATSTGDGSTAI